MVIKPFSFSPVPRIVFGAGTFQKLDESIGRYGKKVLIVTGGKSLRAAGHFQDLLDRLHSRSIQVFETLTAGEPTPDLVDDAMEKFRGEGIDVVAAIGGGSVLDAGKAISAMLPQQDSVMEYLEGVGSGKVHNGVKVPFIAVPTTSGTGSEATKNAVLSRVGLNGFKKSLRHDRFVPDVAVLDPVLTLSCPPDITAASGLDAFTQLLEAYVSTQAQPMTDALAFDAMRHVKDCLIPACTSGSGDVNVRAGMAYASLVSGIVLANAGLGIIHGLASPIGGYFNIPHGVVCGTLLAEAVKINVEMLKEAGDAGVEGLKKYAHVGALLSETNMDDIYSSCARLIHILEDWIKKLKIPRLGQYGMTEGDLDRIVVAGSCKNNPIELEKEQIRQLLLNRL